MIFTGSIGEINMIRRVTVGVEEGLKHDSAIYCDELVSFPKSMLTDYVGTLPDDKIEMVNSALRIALAVG